jgi:hypothetical protein
MVQAPQVVGHVPLDISHLFSILLWNARDDMDANPGELVKARGQRDP